MSEKVVIKASWKGDFIYKAHEVCTDSVINSKITKSVACTALFFYERFSCDLTRVTMSQTVAKNRPHHLCINKSVIRKVKQVDGVCHRYNLWLSHSFLCHKRVCYKKCYSETCQTHNIPKEKKKLQTPASSCRRRSLWLWIEHAVLKISNRLPYPRWQHHSGTCVILSPCDVSAPRINITLELCACSSSQLVTTSRKQCESRSRTRQRMETASLSPSMKSTWRAAYSLQSFITTCLIHVSGVRRCIKIPVSLRSWCLHCIYKQIIMTQMTWVYFK